MNFNPFAYASQQENKAGLQQAFLTYVESDDVVVNYYSTGRSYALAAKTLLGNHWLIHISANEIGTFDMYVCHEDVDTGIVTRDKVAVSYVGETDELNLGALIDYMASGMDESLTLGREVFTANQSAESVKSMKKFLEIAS